MSLSRIFKQERPVASTPYVLENLGLPVAVDNDGQRHERQETEEDIGSRMEELERAAYEQGFSAGEKAGFEFGRQKAETVFSGIASLLNELSVIKQTLLKPCEREMVELCLAIASKVIGVKAEESRELVIESVKNAINAASLSGDILIKINPRDYEAVELYRPEIHKAAEGVRNVRLEADETIGRGGCRIETTFGEIDATIESFISEVERKLRDAF